MSNRIVQALVSALLAAGIFAAGLSLGQLGKAQAASAAVWSDHPLYRPGEMPAFPGAHEYPLGSNLVLNQTPIRASYYETSRQPEAVAQFYVSAFGAGTKVQRNGQDIAVVSTAFGSATTRTVLIKPSGPITYVFPSIYPVSAAPFRISPKADAEIPFDDDSVAAVDLRSSSENGRVVTYQQMRPVEEVEKRYVAAMTERGYRLEERKPVKGGTILDFVGKNKIKVTLVPYSQKTPGTGVLVQVGE